MSADPIRLLGELRLEDLLVLPTVLLLAIIATEALLCACDRRW